VRRNKAFPDNKKTALKIFDYKQAMQENNEIA